MAEAKSISMSKLRHPYDVISAYATCLNDADRVRSWILAVLEKEEGKSHADRFTLQMLDAASRQTRIENDGNVLGCE